MRMGGFRAVGFAVLVSLAVPAAVQGAASAAPQIRLGDIRARLYFTGSGRLSDDILRRNPPFAGWNTCIGEGDASEPADDLLIEVPVLAVVRAGQDGQTNTSVPIVMTAQAGGKVVGQRTVASTLTSHEGVAYQALWLRNVTCGAGTLSIDVRMGNQRKTATLAFDGGE